MRIFLALPISSEMKNYLAQVQHAVKSMTKDIRLVDPQNLHLTLKFLGEVQTDEMETITNKLKAINHPRIVLELLRHLDFFPNGKNPRVLWVGISDETSPKALYEKINSKIGKDFPDDFEFSAHITLGRTSSPLPKIEIERIQQLKAESKRCEVKEFHLMQSVLTAQGPNYSILESFALEE